MSLNLSPAELHGDKTELSGSLPKAFEAVDRPPGSAPRKMAILGCGDLYQKHFRRVFKHRGSECYIYDPNQSKVMPQLNAAEYAVNSLDALPKDASCVFVLTPAHKHLEGILWGLENHIPVVVEKPLVVNSSDCAIIDEALARNHTPLYCIDWAVEHAKPLLTAMGKPVAFPDALTLNDPKGEFKRFMEAGIDSIAIRYVIPEGVKEIIGQTPSGQPWIEKVEQGGGMLLNMGVHFLNLLGEMGLAPDAIDQVQLGTSTKRKGFYQRLGKEADGQKTGELYVNSRFSVKQTDGRTIPVFMETGWNGAVRDEQIEIKNKKGETLRWTFYPGKAELIDATGNPIASAKNSAIDCYACLIDDAIRHSDSKSTTPRHYAEHKAVIDFIERMQATARSETVPPESLIRQRALQYRAAESRQARQM